MFFLKPEKKFKIKLQSPSKSFWSTFKKAFLIKKNFKLFWQNLDKKLLPKELVSLTTTFVNSESYNLVSKFWRHIAINHFKALSLATNKQTQNSIIHADYVSCTFFNKENFESLQNYKSITDCLKLNLNKKHENMTELESKNYNIATAIYYSKKKNSLKKYYELINNNFYEDFSYKIEIDNYNVNQHLLYSLNEFEKIDTLIKKKSDNVKILEFGAGYGRTANILLSLKKDLKYVIVDIPPSIYVSTVQLRKHYPNLKISHAFETTDSSHLENIINESNVTYIFPHQLKLLKENYFDLSIMIGIINETEPKTIKNYMNFVNIVSNNLYMKIFRYSGLPFSFYKFYRFDNKKDYYISNKWKELIFEKGMESDQIQHLGYNIR